MGKAENIKAIAKEIFDYFFAVFSLKICSKFLLSKQVVVFLIDVLEQNQIRLGACLWLR